jgi:hypothetical protein
VGQSLESSSGRVEVMPAERGAILRFVSQQPGVVVSGVYLLSSAIGMLDSWCYYRRFGIDVFLYSDLADFLLASFRSPTAWLIVVYTAVTAVWEYAASLRRSRSPSKQKAGSVSVHPYENVLAIESRAPRQRAGATAD